MAEKKSTKHAHNFKDITGFRFGRLTVVRYQCRGDDGMARWECLCDCGQTKNMGGAVLRSGAVVSCGCYRNSLIVTRSRTHGGSGTKEYLAWSDAKTRCFNKSCQTYPTYGGRGVTMCEEWKNSFHCFIADMGVCPPAMSLDRINNDGNYEPGNCRWATKVTQLRNQRKTIFIDHHGRTITLKELAEISGISYRILYGRYFRGTPLFGPRRRRHT